MTRPNHTLKATLLALATMGYPIQSLAEFDAHQHGLAHLNLVQQGQELEIEFESPLANLVGFEHKPETPTQTKTYLDAVHNLKTHPHFGFKGAECTLMHQELELPFDSTELSAVQDKHHEEHDDHHGEHNEHHDEQHKEHSAHSNLKSHYRYTCSATVTSVSVALFEPMKNLETIEVQWLSDQQQGSAKLNRTSTSLRLQ
ncbi:ZrgA family zinc uptake protein [Echinimonas agarilytica]|uniref:DUF2796 domain-containing protein n=1 Tax=Echinimonas agarilytica TaxID=1215918 RepID=A0AA41W7T6_9GAMM|nr:DUF2796 domain-containing protein [Echinimonas agarilytica]MCM2680356.1 DUF2796 domain-containing protein [Echinimonas agarilytica]